MAGGRRDHHVFADLRRIFDKELDQDIDEYVGPPGSVYDEHRFHSSLLARQATYAHRQDGHRDTAQLSTTDPQ